MKEYLLLGTKGLIGSFIYDYFVKKNIKFNYYNDRLENPILFEKIKLFKPKYIICAAGIVGKPNRDWCLDNPIKTSLFIMCSLISAGLRRINTSNLVEAFILMASSCPVWLRRPKKAFVHLHIIMSTWNACALGRHCSAWQNIVMKTKTPTKIC